jgi:predicted AlkP superfamily pyrophosphatase or phosphodiesterase
LTLGKVTGKNPIYMTLNTADVNSTQVGLNLVDAYVIGWGGQVALNHPFEAYGMPDVHGFGKTIEPVFPGGTVGTTVVSSVTITNTIIAQSGMPNNPGGSLLARLKDQHGNPISNVHILFKSLLATSQSPTVPLPQDARKIMFYDDAACTVAYPLYGECGPYDEEAKPLTDYNGGMTHFVYGNSVNTVYTIMVTAPSFTEVPPVAWKLHIGGYADSPDNYFEPTLGIGALDLYSADGYLVNAAKAGEELKANLKAKLYLIKSEFTVDNSIESCLLGGMQVNCYRVRPKGTILTEPLSHGLVTFKTATGNGVPSSSEEMGNGMYQAKFRTDTMPEKNVIEAWGEAAITMPVIFYDQDKGYHVKLGINPDTVTLKTGQSVYFNKTGDTLVGICRLEYDPSNGTTKTVCYYTDDPKYLQKTTYTAFGIGLDTVVEPQIVLLDDSGRTTVDTTIRYAVQPPEYKAELVDIDLLKAINSNTDVWMEVLYADQTQGQGSAVIGRGSKADIEALYKAEVVMNRGSVMEVKGEKKDLPFAELRALTDEVPPKLVEEIKFGSGRSDRPEKIYILELVSPAMIQKCNSLSGKISVLNKNGQSISLPVLDGQTYAAEYGLQFYKPLLPLENNRCLAHIIDSLDSGSVKDKFIVSNRTRMELSAGTLNTNLYNKAVLYGGIGNRLSITLGELKRDISIEPVGVVILGIDGLRQDVLYPDTMDGQSFENVNDPNGNAYYLDAGALPGLSQILEGNPQNSTKQRYVMLPKVTAIFPSITFASWASIFTGKMPGPANEGTGILGQEFFARDLIMYDPHTEKYSWAMTIPGLESLPPGMMALDATGLAFKPERETKFALEHVIPSETSLLAYISGNDTLRKKIVASALGAALRAQTLWPDINESVNARFKTSSDSDNDTTKCEDTKDECRTVSMFNQYAMAMPGPNGNTVGADRWGTLTASPLNIGDLFDSAFSMTKMMDMAAANEATSFIARYFLRQNIDGKRKRFPAVFSVYFSALDHYAHEEGMAGYANFFKNTTDPQVKQVVEALKDKDEFENKIFIVTADHGHTAMPTNLQYLYESPLYDPETGDFIRINQTYREAEMSCELKTNFAFNSKYSYAGKNARNAERENNNLHIWELGEMMRAIGENGWGQYKILAPKEITKLYKIKDKVTNQIVEMLYGATAKVEKADIIVGLNGPMAHVYLTDVNKLGKIAELFRLTLDDHPAEAAQWWNVDDLDYSDFKVNTTGRLMMSVDKILVRVTGDYCVFDGLNDDGSIRCVATDPLSIPAYIDAWTRINGMNHKDRSGDIVLIMRDATSGNAVDRYTTGVACKSWHGSLNPSDSYVPFIVSYPGGNKTEVEKILQKDTLCKTDYSNCKGNWKLADVVKEIISEQYK